MAGIRFTPGAAQALREAIREAGGVEVFAVGRLDAEGRVADVEVHARGNRSEVPALRGRVEPGEVVIHNHPSGVLEASEADLELAGLFGESGVGVVIVDDEVRRDLWVVEPLRREEVPVTAEEVRTFFATTLPRVLRDCEPRRPQVEMAEAAAEHLSSGGLLVAEAGTGTGKSLAYLVPAVLWATANRGRVLISTYTRTLQDQLVGLDLPVLVRAGLEFRWAVMKGRGNYLCARRLGIVLDDLAADPREGDGERVRTLQDIATWSRTTASGERSDIPFVVPAEVWEEVESDRHQCPGVRCDRYADCFYYRARRAAAGAHVVVVNHSLLFADLAIKQETGGRGLLPAFDRLVLDEAHHLEDAATSAGAGRLTRLAIRRALALLLPRRDGRDGALGRILAAWGGVGSPLPEAERQRVVEAVSVAARLASDLATEAPLYLEAIAHETGLEHVPVALEEWSDGSWLGSLNALAERLAELARALAALEGRLDPAEAPPRQLQPLLDLGRARVRLEAHARLAEAMGTRDREWCRWLEPERREPGAVLCRAPIDVGDFLANAVYQPSRAIVFTSATLAVGGRFDFFFSRVGLDRDTREGEGPTTLTWASPFRFEEQALLLLPRDLPVPDHPDYDRACAEFTVRALAASRGGAFVLCTSFRQLRHLADRAEEVLGSRMTLLRQEAGARTRLLERFREDRDSVLFATDSFWEGVSVKGDALRLVIIPRLPFGVPTEPVTRARHERLREDGKDPFRTWSLPEAVLKLRQGFGRLIRTRTDRGAVAILDRRIHDRWYGRLFLQSLPPACRAVGPSQAVLARLDPFLRAPQASPVEEIP